MRLLLKSINPQDNSWEEQQYYTTDSWGGGVDAGCCGVLCTNLTGGDGIRLLHESHDLT